MDKKNDNTLEVTQMQLGVPYMEDEEGREHRLQRAMNHERKFGRGKEDTLRKRMDSDLFK